MINYMLSLLLLQIYNQKYLFPMNKHKVWLNRMLNYKNESKVLYHSHSISINLISQITNSILISLQLIVIFHFLFKGQIKCNRKQLDQVRNFMIQMQKYRKRILLMIWRTMNIIEKH